MCKCGHDKWEHEVEELWGHDYVFNCELCDCQKFEEAPSDLVQPLVQIKL